jgi:hypothetical protein
MLDKIKSLFKAKEPDRLKVTAQAATNLAPVVVIACGAGMAFWWWTQWARAREEARLAEEKAEADAAGEPPHGEVTDILDTAALSGLDESLAVQADAEPAKATPPNDAA